MRAAALMYSGIAVTACTFALLGFACSSFGSDGGDPSPGSGVEGGGAGDSGGATDGSTTDGSSPDGDAGTVTSDPGVFCAGKYCRPQAEVCCSTLPGGGAGCIPAQSDAGACPGLTFACDDGADCTGGNVCCGSLASNLRDLFGTSCLPLLDCKKLSFWTVACDPTASAACPDNRGCTVPDGGGYGFCDGLRF